MAKRLWGELPEDHGHEPYLCHEVYGKRGKNQCGPVEEIVVDDYILKLEAFLGITVYGGGKPPVKRRGSNTCPCCIRYR
tara:strand:- start:44163 stop:44399 length:237 start_codon:yes stop_codon:yes gene_type:complete